MENQTKKHTLHPLKDYSAVGFDVDHTLAKYNLCDFLPITYKCLAQVLINDKKYPESLLEYGKQEQSFLHNGLIIDIKTGIILKLGEGKLILRAYQGFNRLSDKDIEKVYGGPPVYEIFDPYKTRTSEYLCCLTYYEIALPVLYAKIVELKKKGGRELTEEVLVEILNDCIYAVKMNYNHYDDKKYHPITTFGYFFKDLQKNLSKAVIKMPKMLNALKKLRIKGKVLFLISNSHYEHIKMVMDHAYGTGWEKIFDYIIAKGAKPYFFSLPERTFKSIDIKSENRIGQSCSYLQQHVFYTDGNSKILEDNIKKHKPKLGRILFFGDNFSSDVLAAETNPNWDGVCIMEDLDDPSYGDKYTNEIWGSFSGDDTPYGKVAGYWYKLMHTQVSKVVKAVDTPEMLKFYEE